MSHSDRFAAAYTALDQADLAVRQLHEGCCQPLRSPRMETLAGTLSEARTRLDVTDDATTATAVIEILEDAGSQLGHLQVACCAPDRTRLYAESLDALAKIQRVLTRTFGLDH